MTKIYKSFDGYQVDIPKSGHDARDVWNARQPELDAKDERIKELEVGLLELSKKVNEYADDVDQEITQLEEQLKHEQDCVDFYADKNNWQYRGSNFKGNDSDNISPSYYYGKLARETISKRGKRDE